MGRVEFFRLFGRVLVPAFLLLGMVPGHAAPPTYSLTDVGDLDGQHTYARGINILGHVVGESRFGPNGSTHAFVYRDGSIHDLGTLGGHGSAAYDINDDGDIVGFGYVDLTTNHAFLYRDGLMQDLGPPINGWGLAHDINSTGVVVGGVNFGGSSGGNRAFRYQNGVMEDLGRFGGDSAEAVAINSHGALIGNYFHSVQPFWKHAFMYSDGSVTPIGTFGGDESVAFDINDSGVVVGYAYTTMNGQARAFRFSNGSLVDLGTLPADTHSTAYGINNSGQIVGASEFGSGSNARAVLWHEGAIHNLNELVNASDPLRPFVRLYHATAINESGQIAANGVDSRTGLTRAYLLTPHSPVGPHLVDLTLGHVVIAGCKTVTGRVTLSEPAPAGGRVVTISDTLGAAFPPASVTIAEGAISKTFTIWTTSVEVAQAGIVSATLGGTTLSRDLQIRPMGVKSVTLSPTTVVGGLPATGRAVLECKAGPGPVTVELSSGNAAVAYPVAVNGVVPQGLTTLTFDVATNPVLAKRSVAITATANGTAKSRTLAVDVAAAVTAKALRFGDVPVGTTSAMLSTTLRNRGAVSFAIDSITLTGTNAKYYSKASNCPAVLAAGASCSIGVTFAPVVTGRKSAKLSIATSATSTPLSVSLSGTGI